MEFMAVAETPKKESFMRSFMTSGKPEEWYCLQELLDDGHLSRGSWIEDDMSCKIHSSESCFQVRASGRNAVEYRCI